MSSAVLYTFKLQERPVTDTLLRLCVEDYLGCVFGSLEGAAILRTPHGKPYLPDLPVAVSVSHTGRCFGALIAEKQAGPVGIDIQLARKADYQRIAKRFFTKEEYQYVCNTGMDGFYRLWTRKEALTKCLGLPLGETIGTASLVDEKMLLASVDGIRLIDFEPVGAVYAAAALPADHEIKIRIKEMSESE